MTKPSSLEEDVQQLVWVDAMVEEYDSIIRNSAWDMVPRSVGKSVAQKILGANFIPWAKFKGFPILKGRIFKLH